jgi:hypothetical protein
MASATLIVRDGAMINHPLESGVLGIGTGNFNSEKYPDEKGGETRGATAGLWLLLRGRPESNAFRRVHAGQQFDYRQCRIRVLAVGSDPLGMYVKVEVNDGGAGAKTSGAKKPAVGKKASASARPVKKKKEMMHGNHQEAKQPAGEVIFR